ncbi:hypothetical protein [Helicobacter brantae]|uniref:hypothetical protein n=1 Tax=Helicobacter brantae TaxID=375927 RepID=UPI0014741616|nr:hypothetical protein [Helicobacter brantae]
MKKSIKKKNLFETIVFAHKNKANENITKLIIKAKEEKPKHYAKVQLCHPSDLSL